MMLTIQKNLREVVVFYQLPTSLKQKLPRHIGYLGSMEAGLLPGHFPGQLTRCFCRAKVAASARNL